MEEAKVLCAEKGYVCDPLREQIRAPNTKVNIPKNQIFSATMLI